MAEAGKRRRDERLDVFRGLTMLIIFVAHVPENPWHSWIPAQFGFSSGTELFVFSSGVASAFAFGSIFASRGAGLGTARIAQRMWQVYWAHVGLLFASMALDIGLERLTGVTGVFAAQFGPFLADPAGAVFSAVTLGWLPPYLDILPMYLVILAMVPAVMVARRLHPLLPFAVVALLYGLVWTRGISLEGDPWNHDGWFLNPFAWQLVFFLGFFFAIGWLPMPRLRQRWLVAACAVFLVASIPVTFWGIIHSSETALAIHVWLVPLNAKADLHPLRVLHFLALAYVVLSPVEPARSRLACEFPGYLLVRIGRQSLGTFLASLVLARIAGVVLDLTGRGPLPAAVVNTAGLALVLVCAMVIGWFKSKPWEKSRKPATTGNREPAAMGSVSPTSA